VPRWRHLRFIGLTGTSLQANARWVVTGDLVDLGDLPFFIQSFKPEPRRETAMSLGGEPCCVLPTAPQLPADPLRPPCALH